MRTGNSNGWTVWGLTVCIRRRTLIPSLNKYPPSSRSNSYLHSPLIVCAHA
jgi:hypothetical protein